MTQGGDSLRDKAEASTATESSVADGKDPGLGRLGGDLLAWFDAGKERLTTQAQLVLAEADVALKALVAVLLLILVGVFLLVSTWLLIMGLLANTLLGSGWSLSTVLWFMLAVHLVVLAVMGLLLLASLRQMRFRHTRAGLGRPSAKGDRPDDTLRPSATPKVAETEPDSSPNNREN